MKKDFDYLDLRLKRFREYLDKLYFSGKLKLTELQALRELLNEISNMYQKLKVTMLFGFLPKHAKKDFDRLNSEFTLMEYNVSLLSTSMQTA